MSFDDLETTFMMCGETRIHFRPIHPNDEPEMKDFFYGLSSESVYARFQCCQKHFLDEQIQNFICIDHRCEVVIVGTIPADGGDEIVAVASYHQIPKTNRAEVGFLVLDELHNRGIGTFLLKCLITIAKGTGIAGFTAEVPPANAAMQAVFRKGGVEVNSRLEEGAYIFELDFS
ncbi:MAG: GNAT family N-acetyltransferase [Planctomycetota bacterium]|jgi:RimJ/RimL family protein N-acetyltransferase